MIKALTKEAWGNLPAEKKEEVYLFQKALMTQGFVNTKSQTTAKYGYCPPNSTSLTLVKEVTAEKKTGQIDPRLWPFLGFELSATTCCGKQLVKCLKCGKRVCQTQLTSKKGCPTCSLKSPAPPNETESEKVINTVIDTKAELNKIMATPPPKMKVVNNICSCCEQPTKDKRLVVFNDILTLLPVCPKLATQIRTCPSCQREFIKSYFDCCSFACALKIIKDFNRKLLSYEKALKDLGLTTRLSLTQEAADFYILNQLAFKHEEAKLESENKTNFLAHNFYLYLLLASLGEARHWAGQGYNIISPLINFLPSGATRTFVWLKLPEAITFAGSEMNLLILLYQIFSQTWGPKFGGENWKNVIYQLINYKTNSYSPATFVDTTFGLYHNKALVFDKLWSSPTESLEVVLWYNNNKNMKEVFKRTSLEVRQLAKLCHYIPTNEGEK